MSRLSPSRILAVLQKEFIQLLRDRLTYAMMLGIPIIQLLLFGYAINSDPKRLPTAVLVQDQGKFSRSVVGALERSEYFSIDHVARTPAAVSRSKSSFSGATIRKGSPATISSPDSSASSSP